MGTEPKHSDPWREHERQQARFIFENSTPEQRFFWLEEMVRIFKDQINAVKAKEQQRIDELFRD